MFQFTLPCRERPGHADKLHCTTRFQFTLPCRERLLTFLRLVPLTLFQFTLPCRERLRVAPNGQEHHEVSIHAPV